MMSQGKNWKKKDEEIKKKNCKNNQDLLDICFPWKKKTENPRVLPHFMDGKWGKLPTLITWSLTQGRTSNSNP
jgi:hypothetical protein